MGDRCYVNAHVHIDDKESFVAVVGKPDIESDSVFGKHMAHLEYKEANYGLGDELEEAADRGLRFVAFNAAGDNYYDGAFVSTARNTVGVETNRQGDPIVTVPIHQHELDNAQDFLRMLKELEEDTKCTNG